MLENELKVKCKFDIKLVWPVLFNRFTDDGFGITKGVREDVIYWIQKFNELRKSVQIDKYNWGNVFEYMDLVIYKSGYFYLHGKLSISIHQKETNKFMYIPFRTFHQRHASKNFVWGELKRYVHFNTEEKFSKNSKHDSFYVYVIEDLGNMSSPNYSNTSHFRKGINYSIQNYLFLMFVNAYYSGSREEDCHRRRGNFQPFARGRGNFQSPRFNP